MYSKLEKLLSGRAGNHILPFLWMTGEDISKTLRQLHRAHEAGIGAVCLESRTFEQFGRDAWWQTVTAILEEARRLNMKVWILDDKHFPTGYANGLIETRYPDKSPLMLCEKHIDIIGPGRSEWLVLPFGKNDTLVGVYACKRADRSDKTLSGEVIPLPMPQEKDIVSFDLPEGCWRVFALWATRSAGCMRKNAIDMMDDSSTDVLLEAVYEPHYAHLAPYFGNTLAGFFSDEPCLCNGFFMYGVPDPGHYQRKPGMVGLGMSWHSDFIGILAQKLGTDPRPLLPLLWYDAPDSARVRVAYMDTVADRYSVCFCKKLGDWCRAHGCEYIGHVIEDNDGHTSLAQSCAHYFRSLKWQDMAGMDIVLHQVMPGLADYDNATICATGMVSSSFNHYMLAKLASSLANITPAMKNRAMCEVFGAYGWAEGVSFMKWLIDFLLVRGINRFVPHAFSPIHPNPDCPPHFDADGTNPQFEDFSHLMRYTNAAAELLSGKRVNRLAVLYHAEADWSSMDYTKDNAVAVELTDHHIDFDLLPSENLSPAGADGRLHAGEAAYDALIVPHAAFMPRALIEKIAALGLPVFETDTATPGLNAVVVPLSRLAREMEMRGYKDIFVSGDNRLLRVGHSRNAEADVFMFFNEYTDRCVNAEVTLPVKGAFTRVDLMSGTAQADLAPDGKTVVSLTPYESRILIFDRGEGKAPEIEDELAALPVAFAPAEEKVLKEIPLSPAFAVALADADDLDTYVPFTCGVTPGHMPPLDPRFGGRIRYEAELDLPANTRFLRLKNVGDTACVTLNGSPVLRRICEPFLFPVSPYVKAGKNRLTVTVSTTLARRVRDEFSAYVPMKPFGFTDICAVTEV